MALYHSPHIAVFIAIWSEAAALPQQGQPWSLASPQGGCAGPWHGHGALVPGNPKALSSVGKKKKKVYSSIEQYVATMRKQNDTENQMSEVNIKNNPGVQTYCAMHDSEIYVGSES